MVGDYARSGGSGEGAAVPEADGNTVTCFAPTNPEISRYCWCQDPQRPGDKYQGSGQGAQISSWPLEPPSRLHTSQFKTQSTSRQSGDSSGPSEPWGKKITRKQSPGFGPPGLNPGSAVSPLTRQEWLQHPPCRWG